MKEKNSLDDSGIRVVVQRELLRWGKYNIGEVTWTENWVWGMRERRGSGEGGTEDDAVMWSLCFPARGNTNEGKIHQK